MGDEVTWENLNYVNNVNAAALETEPYVFKQVFQENASHFDDILKVLKEAPPGTPETMLLFPNVMTIVHLLLINPAIFCSYPAIQLSSYPAIFCG